MTEPENSTDVIATAERDGYDEVSASDVDWSGAEVADDATVYLLPGYVADDGNAEVEYPDAVSASEAASEYAEAFDAEQETYWVSIATWQVAVARDVDGELVYGEWERESRDVAIEPEEPDCVDGEEHDWQSPHDILGGCESNPGVWGHGGGVIIHECCMLCGCARITDTWAQNPANGAQGLRSLRYESSKYADEIPSREKRELEHTIACAELRSGAAYVLAAVRELIDHGYVADARTRDVPARAIEVGDYLERVCRAVSRAQERRGLRLALWLAARDQREADAALTIGDLANLGGRS